MRDNIVPDLVKAWFQILQQFQQNNHSADFANAALKCLGLYVTWVDLNLVVTQDFIRGLYQYMSIPELKNAACECLYEVTMCVN